MSDTARKFRELREARGLSIEELSAQTRVGKHTLYNVNRGYRPGYPLVREAIADALGTTEAELFGSDE